MRLDLKTAQALTSEEAKDTMLLFRGMGDDPLAIQESFRGMFPKKVAEAMGELRALRRRATQKFEHGLDMYFTKPQLEQASSAPVATYRARRFAEAGFGEVHDPCCGMGSDAIALALAGLRVHAADKDPIAVHFAAANAEVCGVAGSIEFREADCEEETPTGGALMLDPARRRGSRRIMNPEDWSPPPDVVGRLIADRPGVCMKLSPAVDMATLLSLFPTPDEIEIVSFRGEAKENVFWYGKLASGCARRATILPSGDTYFGDEKAAAPVGELGAYLHDPDPALVRSGLLGAFAEEHGLRVLDPEIAYLTGDEPFESPFLDSFRVLASEALDPRKMRVLLREHEVGRLELRKRGIAERPQTLEQRFLPKRFGDQVRTHRRPAPRHPLRAAGMRSATAAVLLVAPLLAACGGAESGAAHADGVLALALAAEPQSFDPAQAGTAANPFLQRQVLETLVEYDPLAPPDGVQPLLAESWQCSADGLRWSFRLRDDATFHDPAEPPLWPGGNRKLVAADVVASWQRIADPALGADGAWAMEPIVGLVASDARTVEVTLSRPDPYFLRRITTAHFAVVPSELEATAGRSLRDTPVGSGPYALAAWTPRQEAVFRRVAGWRGQRGPDGAPVARIAELRMSYVREAATRTRMFEDGTIARLSPGQDAHQRLLPDGRLAPELAARGVVLHRAAIPDLTLLCFAMRDPALGVVPGDAAGNARRRLLRRALAAAFPYQGWHQVLRPGDSADPARSFLPPQLAEAAGAPDFPWKGGAEQAAGLLAEAGWPGGEGAPALRFEIGGSDAMTRAYADLVVAAWRALGLQVELVVHPDYATLQQKATRGEVMAMVRGWVLDWPDVTQVYDLFDGAQAGQSTNLSRFVDADFDALLDALRGESDAGQRVALSAALCAILNAEVPGVPIDHRGGFLLVQPWLRGFRLHPFDPYPCKFWDLAAESR